MTDVFSGDRAYLQTYGPFFGRVDAPLLRGSFVLTARRFRSQLLHLVDDLAAGRIDVARFSLKANQLVRTEFGIAYSLGALSVDPFHVLTINDVRVIDREMDSERKFLKAFANDLQGKFVVLDPRQRAGLYLQALRGMFELGRINSVPDMPLEWVLGPTEHCLECITAAQNGPYQKNQYSHLGLPLLPGTPGSGEVCLGLTRCGCRLKLAGLPIPNEELQREIRDVLSDVLHDTS